MMLNAGFSGSSLANVTPVDAGVRSSKSGGPCGASRPQAATAQSAAAHTHFDRGAIMRYPSNVLVQGVVLAMLAACSHKAKTNPTPAPARSADVTAEDMRTSPERSIEQQLMAKVPGI